MQHSETVHLEPEKLQLAKKQQTELKESIDSIIITNITRLLSLNYHSDYMG